jgi:hypothetical protein
MAWHSAANEGAEKAQKISIKKAVKYLNLHIVTTFYHIILLAY